MFVKVESQRRHSQKDKGEKKFDTRLFNNIQQIVGVWVLIKSKRGVSGIKISSLIGID